MNEQNIIQTIWDICISLIENASKLWEFITTPQTIKLPLIQDLSFTPINYIGAGIITLIVLWLIKALIPTS